MTEPMPSSIQPDHAAQNPTICCRLSFVLPAAIPTACAATTICPLNEKSGGDSNIVGGIARPGVAECKPPKWLPLWAYSGGNAEAERPARALVNAAPKRKIWTE